jgi:hypothetical protein
MPSTREAIDAALEHGGLVDITTTGRESGQRLDSDSLAPKVRIGSI